MKKILTLVLCLSIIFTFSFASVTSASAATSTDYMKKIVTQLGKVIDGEEAFDYLSYTYMGWRTTGGTWQNQVIANFVPEQLEKAGYNYQGKAQTDQKNKSENDMSSVHDDDYAWVTYYNDISSLTWNPEYARLEVEVPDGVLGSKALEKRIEGEYFAFDPTTEVYQKHYGELYGANNPDEMWDWITKKDDNGKRINVENGKEAELNQRCHLAWQTCFTDPRGTDPAEAKGVEGEAVYVGTIKGRAPNMTCSLVSDLSTLEGKAILSDSSLSNTWSFAQQVGGVAAMSTNSLSNYNLPRDEYGEVIEPFCYSARYAQGGSLANTAKQTATGKPIVSWQFSVDQKKALKELLERAGDKPVTIKSVSIGDTYAMNDPTYGGQGQAVTMAEIKGSKYPDERILICAHVQEPGCNDNATGVGCLTGMAVNLKKAIDAGKIDRPERTITFLWGDEMTMARLYISSHSEECKTLVMSLDMDMTGEDPEKTGGHMRVEKSPDPSAMYLYTLDLLPWEDQLSYDETYTSVHPDNEPGEFVRLPDSHTLWGAGGIGNLFKEGYYLNDLYIDAGNSVTNYIDDGFEVDVCPYEGGSDHSVFLQNQIPALLTWHFTDYTYHSSVDTLNMASAREMGNVNITTAATAFMTANAVNGNEGIAKNILKIVRDAAIDRISNVEKENTDHHVIYASQPNKSSDEELAAEKEVLQAWGNWYAEAIRSVSKYLITQPSEEFLALEKEYADEITAATDEALAYADKVFAENKDDVKEAQRELDNAKAAQAKAEDNLTKAQEKLAEAEKALAEAPEGTDTTELQAAVDAAQTKVDEAQVAYDEATAKVAEAEEALWHAQGYPIDLANAEVKVAKAKVTYNGKAQTPAVTVTLDGNKLTADTDYTVAYKNNKKVGKATVTVTGTGNYAGEATGTFIIKPAKGAIKKLTPAKTTMKVAIKSQKASGVDGYQIAYRKGTGKWKTVKTTKLTYTVKKLTKNSSYSFKVRAYKKIDGKMVYGTYSKVAKKKTKKA